MHLNENAREYYELQITTQTTNGDPVPPEGWEASFDGGSSWSPAVVILHDDEPWSCWLVAGDKADPGDAVAVLSRTATPLVRAVDNPELVVRHAPKVNVQ